MSRKKKNVIVPEMETTTVEKTEDNPQPPATVAEQVLEAETAGQDQEQGLIPTTQTTPAPLKEMLPMRESWGYAGPDSTAVIDVQILEVSEAEEGEDSLEDFGFSEWQALCEDPKCSLEKKLRAGTESLRGAADDYNLLINRTQRDLAKRAIWIGQYLLSLKELVRQKGDAWGKWAEENVSFIGKRSREKYMKIAKRKDCHRYSFLGVDRLDLLCTSTEDFKCDDPVGYLLSKYGIVFDPRSEENLFDFKHRIDAAINMEKVGNKGFSVSFDLIFNLTVFGVAFDKAMLKMMQNIRDCGGNPEAYLEKLSMNAGQDEDDLNGEKRLQDFNTLANRLVKTIDYILRDSEQVSKVDKETFLMLWKKVEELQRVGNLISAEEQAA